MTTLKPINDRNGVLVIVTCFILLIVLSVALRFYARHLTRASRGLDDWLAVAALVSFCPGMRGPKV